MISLFNFYIRIKDRTWKTAEAVTHELCCYFFSLSFSFILNWRAKEGVIINLWNSCILKVFALFMRFLSFICTHHVIIITQFVLHVFYQFLRALFEILIALPPPSPLLHVPFAMPVHIWMYVFFGTSFNNVFYFISVLFSFSAVLKSD